MSKKSQTLKEEAESNSRSFSTLPQKLRLKPLNNNSPIDIVSLRVRIDELEGKVGELEAKIGSKRKRIRRKASEVDKKYNCQFCKKLYGSLVSLNLHIRIKHKREKQQKDEAANANPQEQAGKTI